MSGSHFEGLSYTPGNVKLWESTGTAGGLPLIKLITSLAKKIPCVVTVEENVIQGGFGSAVLECLSDEGLTGNRTLRLGIGDIFVEHGSQKILRAKYGLDGAGIAKAVVDMVKGPQ